jgi:hypothetical protein
MIYVIMLISWSLQNMYLNRLIFGMIAIKLLRDASIKVKYSIRLWEDIKIWTMIHDHHLKIKILLAIWKKILYKILKIFKGILMMTLIFNNKMEERPYHKNQ